MKKHVIAHELGHAISNEIQDGGYEFSYISFESDDKTSYAYCNLDELDRNRFKSYRNLTDVSDLGGIFGELACYKSFYLWWARGDFDNFIICNSKSKSKLVDDVDNLYNKSLYFDNIRKMSRHNRRKNKDKMLIGDLKEYKHLYMAYRDFEKKINKRAYISIVDYLFSSKVKELEYEEFHEYLRKILK